MNKIIGLIPAAGKGERLAPLPFSKELYPIGKQKFSPEEVGYHPKTVSQYLIDQMKEVGTEKLLFIINKYKWDILQYYGNGSAQRIEIGYLIQEKMLGMPFALDMAFNWIDPSTTTLFGMPDTIFIPNNAFSDLLKVHSNQKADLTLGLFPTTKPHKFGMVDFSINDFNYTVDKPISTNLTFMWGIACWNYSFAEFMHSFLLEYTMSPKEIVLGTIFQEAKNNGLKVKVNPFENGIYWDIGTLDDLFAVQDKITQKNY